MECYSEQIVSIFVDGELAVEEAQAPARPPGHVPALPATVGRITR